MNYTAIFSFTKYILFSRHRRGHGIHSPFLFNLVSKVFRNKIDPAIVFNIESIRKELLSSKGSIYVNDLGAGPAKKKSNLRKVSDIARYSSVPPKYGKLLSNLSSEYGKPVILELGTSLGISTLYLASSSTDVTVHTIEGCTATAEIATANFRKASMIMIRFYRCNINPFSPLNVRSWIFLISMRQRVYRISMENHHII